MDVGTDVGAAVAQGEGESVRFGLTVAMLPTGILTTMAYGVLASLLCVYRTGWG